jgi:hypothetical protein
MQENSPFHGRIKSKAAIIHPHFSPWGMAKTASALFAFCLLILGVTTLLGLFGSLNEKAVVTLVTLFIGSYYAIYLSIVLIGLLFDKIPKLRYLCAVILFIGCVYALLHFPAMLNQIILKFDVLKDLLLLKTIAHQIPFVSGVAEQGLYLWYPWGLLAPLLLTLAFLFQTRPKVRKK